MTIQPSGLVYPPLSAGELALDCGSVCGQIPVPLFYLPFFLKFLVVIKGKVELI
jgi:hypothetical protein